MTTNPTTKSVPLVDEERVRLIRAEDPVPNREVQVPIQVEVRRSQRHGATQPELVPLREDSGPIVLEEPVLLVGAVAHGDVEIAIVVEVERCDGEARSCAEVRSEREGPVALVPVDRIGLVEVVAHDQIEIGVRIEIRPHDADRVCSAEFGRFRERRGSRVHPGSACHEDGQEDRVGAADRMEGAADERAMSGSHDEDLRW